MIIILDLIQNNNVESAHYIFLKSLLYDYFFIFKFI